MTKKIVLTVEHLSAGYGKIPTDTIHDIGFTLHEGERLAVIGPNGSGKTTLLRVLAGTLPYRGSVRQRVQDSSSARYGTEVERSALDAREAARETGFLSQLSSSWFPFRAYDVVMLGRYARQRQGINPRPSEEDKLAVRSAMEACGVLDIADETLSELSGGQRQRIFLARTLAQNPAIILLDEPTNHLDLYYQIELLDLVRDKTRGAIGVFHDLSLALRFADTVLLLEDGRVAAKGTPHDVMTGSEINRVYRMNVAETIRSLLQTW